MSRLPASNSLNQIGIIDKARRVSFNVVQGLFPPTARVFAWPSGLNPRALSVEETGSNPIRRPVFFSGRFSKWHGFGLDKRKVA